MANTQKQSDAAKGLSGVGGVDPDLHLKDRVDLVQGDTDKLRPKGEYNVEQHNKPGSSGAEAAMGALDSAKQNNIQNTSNRHDAVAAAAADGVKRANEQAANAAAGTARPGNQQQQQQPGLVGQTTGAVSNVGGRLYDTGAAGVGAAGSIVSSGAGLAGSATSSLFGAVKGLGSSVTGAADSSRRK